MMYSEFIDILREISPTHRDPSPEEYKTIELVYTYHPSIGDKETIVKLWADFGNTIIEDMKPRAKAVMEAEENFRQARLSYEAARDLYLELKEGIK